jgi:hypothetical protein
MSVDTRPTTSTGHHDNASLGHQDDDDMSAEGADEDNVSVEGTDEDNVSAEGTDNDDVSLGHRDDDDAYRECTKDDDDVCREGTAGVCRATCQRDTGTASALRPPTTIFPHTRPFDVAVRRGHRDMRTRMTCVKESPGRVNEDTVRARICQ